MNLHYTDLNYSNCILTFDRRKKERTRFHEIKCMKSIFVQTPLHKLRGPSHFGEKFFIIGPIVVKPSYVYVELNLSNILFVTIFLFWSYIKKMYSIFLSFLKVESSFFFLLAYLNPDLARYLL